MLEIIHNDFELWKELTSNEKDIDLYYLPNYLKVFSNNGDGLTQVAIVFIDSDNYLLFPYFLREIANTEYNDIITPYGFGGIYLKGNKIDPNDFYTSFKKYCNGKKIISLFNRFHLFDSSYEGFIGELQNTNDVLIVDTSKDMETIESEYHRSVRKSIRVAEKNGVEVVIDEKLEYLKEFYEIYIGAMKSNNANKYYHFSFDFFIDFKKYLGNNIKLFHSVYDNEIVASELVLFSKKYAYSFLGGSKKDYLQFRTNNILKHKIIEWTNKMNIKYFVLGGGYSKEDGIFKYKQTFTKSEPLKFFVGKWIFHNGVYDELTKQHLKSLCIEIDEEKEINFFPKYRYGL